jgi:hypothetical protein
MTALRRGRTIWVRVPLAGLSLEGLKSHGAQPCWISVAKLAGMSAKFTGEERRITISEGVTRQQTIEGAQGH